MIINISASNISALVYPLGFEVEAIDGRQCFIGKPDNLTVEVDGLAMLQALNAIGADHLSTENIQEQIDFLGQ